MFIKLNVVQVLQSVFLKCESVVLGGTILDAVSTIYHGDNANYFLLQVGGNKQNNPILKETLLPILLYSMLVFFSGFQFRADAYLCFCWIKPSVLTAFSTEGLKHYSIYPYPYLVFDLFNNNKKLDFLS